MGREISAGMPNNTLCAVSLDELVTATGGQWKMPRSPQSRGSGPQHPMELLDKPGKTLDLVRRGLGIPDSGSPGQTYTPATANPDGSVNPGRFHTPRSGPEVPMSQ